VSAIERVLACGNNLGEGPVWCPSARVLWWLDITGPTLWRLDPATGHAEHWPLPKLAGSLAVRRDGGLVFAFRAGFALMDTPGGEVRWLPTPGNDFTEARFNDGKTDRAGRFWTGAMDRKLHRPVGDLFSLDANHAVRRFPAAVTISNGIGFSPDNRTLYHADTPSRNIYAWDFDLASGDLANRRVFAQVEAGHGGPDGLTVDAEGGVWSVQIERWCIHRYDPAGRLERVVKVPVQYPTSVMFGGPDLATLYITTARMNLDAAGLAAQPLAGDVLAIDPGVRGLPETPFGGTHA